MPEPTCCYAGPGGVKCVNPAMWRIHERGTTAEGQDCAYTESCEAHVGKLLSHSGEPLGVVYYEVWPIKPATT